MPSSIRKIGCYTLALLVVLFLIRAQVLDIALRLVFGYYGAFVVVLIASYNDFVWAAGLGAAAMLLAWLLRRQPRAQAFLRGAFLGLALLSVAVGLSYITTSKLLGGPLTYAWLYYSDFLQNNDAKSALLANLSWGWAGEVLGWCVALLGIGYLLQAAFRRFDPQHRWFRLVMLTTAACVLLLAVNGPRLAIRHDLPYKSVANPVLAFGASVYASLAMAPDLLSMHVPPAFEAFPTPPPAGSGPSRAPFNGRVRNVVLFVLESVPAEYVPGYQPRQDVMPNLARCLPHSLRISDMYAQIPSTNNAVVALLGSLYPLISYQSITKEYPAIRVPSLSSELKQQHFRTGFFFAADTRFQNMQGFLGHRGFDTLADVQTIACAKPTQQVSQEPTDFLGSADESCLVKACAQWLPADSTGAPFFATVWTAQTHYPYFPVGQEKNYGVKERYLNRYLNALHYSDAQLGRLLEELQRRGLAESTLVVVVGDHGEAFGRHVQYGHASNIYEENVHIPLLFINPLLFHGETLQAIGGQVDVAPSLLDILHLPIPAAWQGTSLFNPARLNRAYFFSPYSRYVFGLRTGPYKVIFNVNSSETLVFDLHQDPHETYNLADQMPEFVQQSHQRLARWVQYQDAYLKRVLKSEPPIRPVGSLPGH